MEFKRRARLRMRARARYEYWRQCKPSLTPAPVEADAGVDPAPAAPPGDCAEGACVGGGEDPSADSPTDAQNARDPAEMDDEASYSETTTQEAGIGESDFVKTDGEHLYALGAGALKVVRFWPEVEDASVPEPELVDTFKLHANEAPRGLFLDAEHDRLIVYTDVLSGDDLIELEMNDGRLEPMLECELGVHCKFKPEHSSFRIRTFELNNGKGLNESIVDAYLFNGGYMKSYQVRDLIYTVVGFRQHEITGLTFEFSECSRDAFDRVITANDALINGFERVESILPHAQIEYEDGQPMSTAESHRLTECEDVLMREGEPRAWFITVFAQRTSGGELNQLSTILSRPGAVYSSGQRIYIAVPYSRSPMLETWFDGIQEDEATMIHRFDLSKGGRFTDANGSPICEYQMSGVIPGRIIDAFNMGEWNGDLRIATNHGFTPMGASAYVLTEDPFEADRVLEPDPVAPDASIWDDPDASATIETPADPPTDEAPAHLYRWHKLNLVGARGGALKTMSESEISSALDEQIGVVRHTEARTFIQVQGEPRLKMYHLDDDAQLSHVRDIELSTSRPYFIYPLGEDRGLVLGEARVDSGLTSDAWEGGEAWDSFEKGGLTMDLINFNEEAAYDKMAIPSGASTATYDHHALTLYHQAADEAEGLEARTHIALPIARCTTESDRPNGAFGVWTIPRRQDASQQYQFRWAPHPEVDFCAPNAGEPEGFTRALFIDDYILTISEARLRVTAIDALPTSYLTESPLCEASLEGDAP